MFYKFFFFDKSVKEKYNYESENANNFILNCQEKIGLIQVDLIILNLVSKKKLTMRFLLMNLNFYKYLSCDSYLKKKYNFKIILHNEIEIKRNSKLFSFYF